jgi:hypothetical protein
MKFDNEIFRKITEPIRNMLDIKNPKITPPKTFPNKIDLRDNGASNNRSNVFVLLSKTITIASAEVEAKSTDMAIKPGSSSFNPEGFLRMHARVITTGNIMPQLMFGALK